ncbi:MAG TPA: restriction endonuclease [Pseudobacteroides sp.]|uniref:restriction endonuclease n=1 Tax=Pseudobacteroides sp. TaxID=1968840 RepID=UPI002F948DEC
MSNKVYEFKIGTKCSVNGCERLAEYEVYLYDYYRIVDEEFYQQDYTCPFICSHHMAENEEKAKGERKPRGYVSYPFSNKHGAQGYTKYEPLREVYSEIFMNEKSIILPKSRIIVSEVNEDLMKFLKENPSFLREINPRLFEKVIAEIFASKGFDVTLTKQTRDGGKDIYAAKNNSIGSILYIIECKRYAEDNPVGVELVRGLYGVKMQERATMAIIASTSFFTSEAVKFANPIQYELSLRDFDALKKWLNEYKFQR